MALIMLPISNVLCPHGVHQYQGCEFSSLALFLNECLDHAFGNGALNALNDGLGTMIKGRRDE